MEELNNNSLDARDGQPNAGSAHAGLRKMPMVCVMQTMLLAGIVLVLAACGGAQQRRHATDQYNRCRDQEEHVDATGCWKVFLEEFKKVASTSEIDYAERYLRGRSGSPGGPGQSDGGDGGEASRIELAGESGSMFPAQQVSFRDCYERFRPTGDSQADVRWLGRLCGGPCGMVAFSDIRAGTQSQSERAEAYTINLRNDRCYRFIAVGGRGIVDLDTAILDPSGDVVEKDLRRDSWPILGINTAFCPISSGEFRFVVDVVTGGGRYHFQVWEGALQ
ncbi:MAG: hypothetical protein FWD57_16645 [Polyangiaceae bacterium]|nr:hypothetical protein [Polyangiaceae bacterium]